uniref:Uncharacterized protein n=1 Tax=Pithovirus LCDPAC01 TaxID=2506600 RepID=A0A481YMM9_9VIRU|nr:MAG: hypothetical protein LCDPAC01_00700 [Pithovirus LCDPAC01]
MINEKIFGKELERITDYIITRVELKNGKFYYKGQKTNPELKYPMDVKLFRFKAEEFEETDIHLGNNVYLAPPAGVEVWEVPYFMSVQIDGINFTDVVTLTTSHISPINYNTILIDRKLTDYERWKINEDKLISLMSHLVTFGSVPAYLYSQYKYDIKNAILGVIQSGDTINDRVREFVHLFYSNVKEQNWNRIFQDLLNDYDKFNDKLKKDIIRGSIPIPIKDIRRIVTEY